MTAYPISISGAGTAPATYSGPATTGTAGTGMPGSSGGFAALYNAQIGNSEIRPAASETESNRSLAPSSIAASSTDEARAPLNGGNEKIANLNRVNLNHVNQNLDNHDLDNQKPSPANLNSVTVKLKDSEDGNDSEKKNQDTIPNSSLPAVTLPVILQINMPQVNIPQVNVMPQIKMTPDSDNAEHAEHASSDLKSDHTTMPLSENTSSHGKAEPSQQIANATGASAANTAVLLPTGFELNRTTVSMSLPLQSPKKDAPQSGIERTDSHGGRIEVSLEAASSNDNVADVPVSVSPVSSAPSPATAFSTASALFSNVSFHQPQSAGEPQANASLPSFDDTSNSDISNSDISNSDILNDSPPQTADIATTDLNSTVAAAAPAVPASVDEAPRISVGRSSGWMNQDWMNQDTDATAPALSSDSVPENDGHLQISIPRVLQPESIESKAHLSTPTIPESHPLHPPSRHEERDFTSAVDMAAGTSTPLSREHSLGLNSVISRASSGSASGSSTISSPQSNSSGPRPAELRSTELRPAEPNSINASSSNLSSSSAPDHLYSTTQAATNSGGEPGQSSSKDSQPEKVETADSSSAKSSAVPQSPADAAPDAVFATPLAASATTTSTTTTSSAVGTPALAATLAPASDPGRPAGSADSPANLPSSVEQPLVQMQSAAPAGPVQIAQMVSKAAQSEMHIGLTTAAFGSVEVHTVVHANDVGVLIGSEKGDLHSLLSSELPGIASSLQQQNLRLSQVNFQHGFSFSNQTSSGGGDQPQRWFTAKTPGSTSSSSDMAGKENSDLPEDSRAGSSFGSHSRAGTGGLSILA